MNKNEAGIKRIEKMTELKGKIANYKTVIKQLNQYFEQGFGGRFELSAPINLLEDIVEASEGVEFLKKEDYCDFCNRIMVFYGYEDLCTESMRTLGSDFGSFSLINVLGDAIDMLEACTYDNILSDYPGTEELIWNGKFSYWLVEDDTTEHIIDSPEKCWEYLKEGYDALTN